MKKPIVIALLAYLSFACSETKEKNVSVAEESTEAQSDSISNETFQIDLLANEIQEEMLRFSKIIEQEIFEFKVQSGNLSGQPKADLDKAIKELQQSKDVFNNKLEKLNPYSSEDQTQTLKDLDSITEQIQSQIRKIQDKH